MPKAYSIGINVIVASIIAYTYRHPTFTCRTSALVPSSSASRFYWIPLLAFHTATTIRKPSDRHQCSSSSSLDQHPTLISCCARVFSSSPHAQAPCNSCATALIKPLCPERQFPCFGDAPFTCRLWPFAVVSHWPDIPLPWAVCYANDTFFILTYFYERENGFYRRRLR